MNFGSNMFEAIGEGLFNVLVDRWGRRAAVTFRRPTSFISALVLMVVLLNTCSMFTANIEDLEREMTAEDFVKSLDRPQAGFEAFRKLSGRDRRKLNEWFSLPKHEKRQYFMSNRQIMQSLAPVLFALSPEMAPKPSRQSTKALRSNGEMSKMGTSGRQVESALEDVRARAKYGTQAVVGGPGKRATRVVK